MNPFTASLRAEWRSVDATIAIDGHLDGERCGKPCAHIANERLLAEALRENASLMPFPSAEDAE